MKNPIMTIEMKSGNKIVMELYPEHARNTVNSIISIAQKGYYNGKIIYRVVKDFVIQTGCDGENIVEDACYVIEKECASSGHHTNSPSFTKGIVGIAGTRECASGSSFFIMTGDSPGLDGDFAVIGRVIEGMEEVERINNVECNATYFRNIPFFSPIKPEIMTHVSIDTFGAEYQPPVIMETPQSYIDQENEIKEARGLQNCEEFF